MKWLKINSSRGRLLDQRETLICMAGATSSATKEKTESVLEKAKAISKRKKTKDYE